jgi:hypothetical protein
LIVQHLGPIASAYVKIRQGRLMIRKALLPFYKDEMIKASITLQDLRRRIYVKAKAETSWRFLGLYVHVCKMETLREAYVLAKNNDGAPGVDGLAVNNEAGPFRALYDANLQRVHHLLARMVGAQDAEDLTQVVFAKAAKA